MLAQQLTGAMQSLALLVGRAPRGAARTLVDSAMDFCWLGLGQVRDGERSAAYGVRAVAARPRAAATAGRAARGNPSSV